MEETTKMEEQKIEPAETVPAQVITMEACEEVFEKRFEKAEQKYRIFFTGAHKDWLLNRLKVSEALREDFMQKHKDFNKCGNYLYDKARKVAGRGSGVAVEDHTVYEWIEDYFHKDDKAEEEEKKKKAAEAKKKAAEKKKEAVPFKPYEKNKAIEKATKKEDPKPEKPKEKDPVKKLEDITGVKPKPKSKSKEAEGQMSMFDFLG